jgi:hypothetical protein
LLTYQRQVRLTDSRCSELLDEDIPLIDLEETFLTLADNLVLGSPSGPPKQPSSLGNRQ